MPELLGTMSDPSWTVRRAGVAALAAAGDDAARPLCAWLANARTSENAIAAAVDALAASIGAGTNACVQELLAHAEPAVITDGISILGRRRARESAVAIEPLLAHADDNVAIAAIDALGAIGEGSSIEPLLAVLAGDSFFRTFAVLQSLPRIADPRAVAPLAKLLDSDMYRVEAIQALGRTGSVLAIAPLAQLLARSPGDALIPPLGKAFAELLARAAFNGTAAPAIAELRARLAGALPRFANALRSADDRAAIARLLGEIGDASVLPALSRLLDDPALAEIATAAMQQIGRAADDAVLAALANGDAATRIAVLPVVTAAAAAPAVLALLGDDSPDVRAAACEAVARLGATAAVPTLFGLLADANTRVAHAAAAAIQSLGTADTGKLVVATLAAGTAAARRQALRVAAYLGLGGAFDAVRAALADADPRIAELAVAALAAMDDPRVAPAIAELARDPRDPMRAAAMRALGQRADVDALVRGTDDAAAWVRYYACQGLGRLGTGAPALVARLADTAPHVRIAAIEALGRLATPEAWDAIAISARSPEPDERRAALAGLGPRSEALVLLLEAAADPDEATRLIAIAGLAHRSEPEALAALVDAARAPSVELQQAAISLLAERTDAPAAEATIELALAAPHDAPIHLALSRPSPARIAAIAARLATTDERETTVLVAALARMRALAPLTSALALANPIARRLAATTLIALHARADAARLATTDPDVDVRNAIAAAL